MKNLFAVKFLLLSIIFCGCYNSEYNNRTSHSGYNRQNFPNVLNLHNVPGQTVDWSAFCFSDKGSWFGFALPDTNTFYGGFIGPFVMSEGKWFSKSILDLKILDVQNDSRIDLNSGILTSNYYPGMLEQKIQQNDLLIVMNLIFMSDKTAIVKYRVENLGNNSRLLQPRWTGSVFEKTACFKNNNNDLFVFSNNDTTYFKIDIGPHDFISINDNGTSFFANGKPFILNKNETQIIFTSLSFNSKKEIKPSEANFTHNEKRWNRYLNQVLTTENEWGSQTKYQKIAVKSLCTLVNNWRKPYGHLIHQGLFPSYAVDYFNGFWAWDSWKHAVALVLFEPELAKDQVRAMFDYQNDKGMVADCIFADSTQNNWLNTKPPLASWAVYNIFKSTHDTAFVIEMLPRLVNYHNWWYERRDFNRNLLCEYGSTNHSLIAAKWESGMDNAIRFDHSTMIKVDNNNWAFNQESVDLNSFLYQEKMLLGKMYEILGNTEKANVYWQEAGAIKQLINQYLFDKQSGYYYDLNAKSGELVKVQGPEGWAPLFAKVSKQNMAKRVMQNMMDSSKFSSYIPFPTASVSDTQFSTGYWRGPVWLDQSYFAITALVNYKKGAEAKRYTYHMFDRLEGLTEDLPIRENYWPLNGKGMRVNHFSWSAAHLLLLYKMNFTDSLEK